MELINLCIVENLIFQHGLCASNCKYLLRFSNDMDCTVSHLARGIVTSTRVLASSFVSLVTPNVEVDDFVHDQ